MRRSLVAALLLASVAVSGCATTSARESRAATFDGLPVLSVPLNSPGQLPVGVQIIAAPWREDLILGAARRLQTEGVIAAYPPEAFR